MPRRISLYAAAVISIAALSCAHAQVAEYRTIDGTGNNIANPDFGAAGSQFVRKGASAYGDNLDSPSGAGRPNPRAISTQVSSQASPVLNGMQYSNLVWLWGQFIDHDITLSETSSESFSIPVAAGDPLFPSIPMNRTAIDPLTGGLSGVPREQVNAITSFLDASMVYGSDSARAAALRDPAGGGRLAESSPDMLPFNTGNLFQNANDSHVLPGDQLFLAGDVRANEHVGLTAMHTVFVREHNRIANSLAGSGMTDEQIYQKTRSMVSGEVQAITYNEFLPALIGNDAPALTGTYNENVDPGIANEFASALFRLGHSMVSSELTKAKPDGSTEMTLSMDEAFFTSPNYLQSSEDIDMFLKGFAATKQQELDPLVIDELQNKLFGAPGSGGLDLVSLNLQRGRDHGLPDYNTIRDYYGLPSLMTFDQITSDAALANALELAYGGDISLVDPWIGALAEDHLDGKGVGALIEAALLDQFTRLRDGDRFFFLWDENLTADERAAIMNRSLADIIMDNTSIISMQGNVFFVPEPSQLLFLLLAAAAFTARRRR